MTRKLIAGAARIFSSRAMRYAVLALLGLWLTVYFGALLYAPVRLEIAFRPRLNREFDPKIWKQGCREIKGKAKPRINPNYGVRYEMLDHLMTSSLSPGTAADEVRTMLGNPDSGIMDKRWVLALPKAYGSFNQYHNEILESADEIAHWSYALAHRSNYPARSSLFPGLFWNEDDWLLTIKMTNGRISKITIGF